MKLSGHAEQDHAAAIVGPQQETFTEALEFTPEFTPRAFPNPTKHLPSTWVEEALLATGDRHGSQAKASG